MASLKAFLPQLAKVVGKTADELYSRQRALTQIGVLKAVEGRGPGSGVPLSGEAVAAMVIALMASDNLQQTDARIRRACHASPTGRVATRLAGATNLQMAVAEILLSEEGSDLISINQGSYADIFCDRDKPTEARTRFVISHSFRPPPIRTIKEMEPEHIRYISRALRATLGDQHE
jgi:hypothetical protein